MMSKKYIDSDKKVLKFKEVKLDNIKELEPAVMPAFGICCSCGGWNFGFGCGD